MLFKVSCYLLAFVLSLWLWWVVLSIIFG